jgi:hypothetical protein
MAYYQAFRIGTITALRKHTREKYESNAAFYLYHHEVFSN